MSDETKTGGRTEDIRGTGSRAGSGPAEGMRATDGRAEVARTADNRDERGPATGGRGVCVITGGSGGMGLACAHRMGRAGYELVLAARNPQRLERAVAGLADEGIVAHACPCDVSDQASVARLAELAASLGRVSAVLHVAGMSPHMGDAERIMAGNALGTIHVHNAFFSLVEPGGALIDTSSMSAHLTPGLVMPTRAFALAQTDVGRFMGKMMGRVSLFPRDARPGVAYAISKRFVIEYARKEAARFGGRGVRVLSITPGNFETPMGELEAEEAGRYTRRCAIKRLGRPDEIAVLYEACADPAMGYLTGCDIICDGGCIASGASAFSR